MRSSFAKFLYSIILTASISTLVGLIFRSNFWYMFTLTTILQVTGFLVLNQIYTNRLKQSLEVIKADQLREQNRNYVTSYVLAIKKIYSLLIYDLIQNLFMYVINAISR